MGERLAPILVQLEGDPATPRPVAGFERPRSPVDHRGYALIWFASAAACFASWVEFGRRRARESSGGP
jgi:cytochrome oxidase assembly protein ShyY1